jgi:hypothetical protein
LFGVIQRRCCVVLPLMLNAPTFISAMSQPLWSTGLFSFFAFFNSFVYRGCTNACAGAVDAGVAGPIQPLDVNHANHVPANRNAADERRSGGR